MATATPLRWPNGLRACFVCGRSGVQIPDWPNLTQRSKRFTTALTST